MPYVRSEFLWQCLANILKKLWQIAGVARQSIFSSSRRGHIQDIPEERDGNDA